MRQTQDYILKGAVLFDECSIRQAMPELLKAGLEPVSPDWVMDIRNDNPDAQHDSWTNYFDTDMGMARNGDNVLVLPHSAQLRQLTAKTPRTDGGVKLENGQDAQEYNVNEHIFGRPLTEKEAHEHKPWLALAGGSQDRLDNFVTNTFKFGKDVYGYDKMMGLYVPSDKNVLRAVVLCGLNILCDAGGSRVLGYGARLVGVQSEVAEGDCQKVKTYTQMEISAALERAGLSGLDAILHKELQKRNK